MAKSGVKFKDTMAAYDQMCIRDRDEILRSCQLVAADVALEIVQ